ALTACRSLDALSTLRFAHLFVEYKKIRFRHDLNRPELVEEALAYSRDTRNLVALRGAVYGVALHAGYLAGKSPETLKEMRPYLTKGLFDRNRTDPILTLLGDLDTLPAIILAQEMFQEPAQPIADRLFLNAYYAGNI